MSTGYSSNCHLLSYHLGGLVPNQNHQSISVLQSQKDSQVFSNVILELRTTLTAAKKVLLGPISDGVALGTAFMMVRFPDVNQDSVNWVKIRTSITAIPNTSFT